jgi:deoxyribose-phosphate aldolase
MNTKDLAKYIDHTNVKPTVTVKDIIKLCHEAKQYNFHSVCVTPVYVKLAKSLLKNSGVKVVTVIGFPHGSETSLAKVVATREAIKNGADEIDMVINDGALLSGDYQLVKKEMALVKKAAGRHNTKVILETGYLTSAQIKKACLLARQAKLDFVKTATGYGLRGATIADIKLIRKTVGPKMGVKASGGIKDASTAWAMIKAGATRIGTSAGVAIVMGKKSKANY